MGETNERFIVAHLFLFFSMLFFYFCHVLCLYEHEITSQCAKPSPEHGQHLCWSPTRDKGTTCYCWKTKADRVLTWALRVTAAWPTCRHDQVAQLSQVHMCLCSLCNYGKYYCSLLPLTELCALTRGTKGPVERQSFSAAPGDFCPAVVVIKQKKKESNISNRLWLSNLLTLSHQRHLKTPCPGPYLGCFPLDFFCGHHSGCPQGGKT